MFKQPIDSQDVIRLLSKLKDRTPDYPVDLMAARKATFLQQVVAINIDGNGLSGKGGGDGGIGGSGGSGTLGGMSTAQAILLQAVIGVWVIAAMLTAAYVFRGQIIDLLQDNGIIVEMTQVPLSESTVPATMSPATEIPTTEVTSTSGPATPGDLPVIETTPDGSSDIQDTPDGPKDNPGLHLGQTPGTPDKPNQDKPDKPDKTDKRK
jgi:hypothetical protein